MPQSTHLDIANAVRVAIQTIPSAPTIKVRAQMFLIDEDSLPLIVVTMGEEQSGEVYFGGGQFRSYEIVVTALVAQNQQIESGIGTAKGWRDAIKQRLVPDWMTAPSATLPGVSSVWQVMAVELPGEDPRAYANNYETARLGLIYRTSEATHA